MHIEHRSWSDSSARADSRPVLKRVRTALASFLPGRAAAVDGAASRFQERLASVCNDTAALIRDPLLSLSLSCVVEGEPSAGQVPVLLCLAHHLVGNAVRHGMAMHLLGRVEVRVEA